MTRTFSWQLACKEGLATRIRRAKTKATLKCNPTFNTEHADECRDAQSKNFTKLVKRKTEEADKHYERYINKIKKLKGEK